jgi:glycosyltransferase involved in cell wall biosynthesis
LKCGPAIQREEGIAQFQPLDVMFYQRKPRANANFSLEFIFHDVRSRLVGKIRPKVRVAPCLSNGVLRRIAICIDAWSHQGQVNHLTGDINFVATVLSHKRTILTVLDCGFLVRTTGWKRKLLKLLWLDWPVQRAALVTTISNRVREEIVGLTGCSPSKVRVIPVAVSDAFQRVDRPFKKEQPRILQVGTAENKNLPRLIRSLERLPCTLAIIGPINADCQELIRAHGIKVENYINLPHNEVVRQYEIADIVAFPSTYEGFGMPIVEGNVVGRAVLTSNVSSMPEVAGDAACLVDPLSVESIRKGIDRIISDIAYRQMLLQNGYENAKRFRADTIAEQYFDAYREVMSTA